MKMIADFRFAVLSLAIGSSLAVAPAQVQAAYSPKVDAVADGQGLSKDVVARRGRGADDAPGDDRGRGKRGRGADDGANHTFNLLFPEAFETARRGRGADDAPGDDRGRGKRGRGADDGPNHT